MGLLDHCIAQGCDFSAATEEGAHDVLSADQQGHDKHQENQGAEEAVEVAGPVTEFCKLVSQDS